jgi:hypothetical protein
MTTGLLWGEEPRRRYHDMRAYRDLLGDGDKRGNAGATPTRAHLGPTAPTKCGGDGTGRTHRKPTSTQCGMRGVTGRVGTKASPGAPHRHPGWTGRGGG